MGIIYVYAIVYIYMAHTWELCVIYNHVDTMTLSSNSGYNAGNYNVNSVSTYYMVHG